MPTLQDRIEALEARVAVIEATPKVKAYLDGGQWPRTVMLGEGTISSGEQDKLAFEKAHPKSKQLVAAEELAAAAQTEFEAAQRAWIDASRVEPGGRYMSTDAYGNSVVVDVPADSLIQTRKDVAEFQPFDAAERKLIAARVRLYKLQRARDSERQAYDLKRNPIVNPGKEEKSSSWSRRVRLGSLGK